MKRFIRKYKWYQVIRNVYQNIIVRPFPKTISIREKTKLVIDFAKDMKNYKKLLEDKNFPFVWEDLYVQLFDKTEETPLNFGYFYQDCWCAQKVFENKPKKHHDIGSKIEMVGIISQFTPTVMIDIRPFATNLPNFEIIKGDITNLPMKDNEVESLSSICVIEHVGLGRYGDPLDTDGTYKAISELKRVLALGGNLYISIPVENKNRLYFNAHRSFNPNFIIDLFKPLTLVEDKYIYGKSMSKDYKADRSGIGLFHFRKTK